MWKPFGVLIAWAGASAVQTLKLEAPILVGYDRGRSRGLRRDGPVP